MNSSQFAFFSSMCDHCQRFDLFNMLNDALVLVDSQNGQILFMNQKALEMYQYTSEECLRLFIENICHDSVALIRENMRLAKQHDDGYVFTANHRTKDGSIFKVEVSTRYMKLHGKAILASVVRDVTSDGKMREEIQLAGKVQRRFLPRNLENDLFRICSVYQPHNYVSGDLYDFSFDEKSKILHGIVIDVMGHGVATAFQTSILKYLFLRVIEKSIPINDKLAWVNKEVMPFFIGGGFAGVFLFEFDFKCNTLTYSAGGINSFIALRPQGHLVVKAPGLFLGINEEEVFDQGVYRFLSGESFFFLTDGLFELLSQPIASDLDFWGMHEMCKSLTASCKCIDDASSVGILIR